MRLHPLFQDAARCTTNPIAHHVAMMLRHFPPPAAGAANAPPELEVRFGGLFARGAGPLRLPLTTAAVVLRGPSTFVPGVERAAWVLLRKRLDEAAAAGGGGGGGEGAAPRWSVDVTAAPVRVGGSGGVRHHFSVVGASAAAAAIVDPSLDDTTAVADSADSADNAPLTLRFERSVRKRRDGGHASCDVYQPHTGIDTRVSLLVEEPWDPLVVAAAAASETATTATSEGSEAPEAPEPCVCHIRRRQRLTYAFGDFTVDLSVVDTRHEAFPLLARPGAAPVVYARGPGGGPPKGVRTFEAELEVAPHVAAGLLGTAVDFAAQLEAADGICAAVNVLTAMMPARRRF